MIEEEVCHIGTVRNIVIKGLIERTLELIDEVTEPDHARQLETWLADTGKHFVSTSRRLQELLGRET